MGIEQIDQEGEKSELLNFLRLRSQKGTDPVYENTWLLDSHEQYADAVYKIQPDDLLPFARKRYDDFLKRNNLEQIPIFLDQNLHKNFSTPLFYNTSSVGFTGNMDQFYMLISEYNHRWTLENLERERTNPYPPKPTELMPNTNPSVIRQLNAMSQALSITPVPDLYVSEKTYGNAARTRNGEYFVVLNASMTEDEQVAVLAHELGHIAKRHLEPESIIRLHNSQSEMRNAVIEQEKEADQVASRLCQGEAFSNLVQKWMHDAEIRTQGVDKESLKWSGEIDDNDKLASPSHPAYEERIAMLKSIEQAARKAGTCPSPARETKER